MTFKLGARQLQRPSSAASDRLLHRSTAARHDFLQHDHMTLAGRSLQADSRTRRDATRLADRQSADQHQAAGKRPGRLASGSAPRRRSHSCQHHGPRETRPPVRLRIRNDWADRGVVRSPGEDLGSSRQDACSAVVKAPASTKTTAEPPPWLGTRSERRAQPTPRQCTPSPRAKTPVARPAIPVQSPSRRRWPPLHHRLETLTGTCPVSGPARPCPATRPRPQQPLQLGRVAAAHVPTTRHGAPGRPRRMDRTAATAPSSTTAP
jgi:hypothetical protein